MLAVERVLAQRNGSRAAHQTNPAPPLSAGQVAAWPGFIRGYNSVLRAVHGVFSELEREEREGGQQQRSNGKVGSAAALAAAGPNGAGNGAAAAAGEEGSAPPSSRRRVVNPNQLREALSELPGELFKEGVYVCGYGYRCGCGWLYGGGGEG